MGDSAFPHLADYLDRLPIGLDSYPHCLSKGTIIRSSLGRRRADPSWQALPERIRNVLERPPLPEEWVSTVLTDAVFYVLVDTHYPTKQDIAKWCYDRVVEQSNFPIYRLLTRVAGLSNFLRGAVKLHGFLQRGTDVKLQLDDRGADIVLSHPNYLHCGLNHFSNESVFRAALDVAGATETHVDMTESTPAYARYRATWKRR